MLDLVCAYCAHRVLAGALHCVHCGAPARAAAHPPSHTDPARPGPGVAPTATAKPVSSQEPNTANPVESPKPSAEEDMWQTWVPPLVLAAVLVIVLVAVVRLFSGEESRQVTNPVDALPGPLRTAATCQPDAGGAARSRCVVRAGHPLLTGRLSGGQDLDFYAQLLPEPNLAVTLARWRDQGGRIITDGTVFAAVGASRNVLFADTRTGLRIDTAALADERSAQDFAVRAGLTRQPL